MTLCNISSIFRDIFKFKKLLFWGQVVAVFATLLISVVPLFIPLLVDELLLHKEPRLTFVVSKYLGEMSVSGYVFVILGVIILLRVSSTMLGIVQSRIFTTISKKITYKLRIALLNHLKLVSLKEYENFSVGSITSKLVTDIETLDGFISTTISKLVIAVLTLLFSSIVLLWIHWQLALFILITNPIVVFFTAKLSRNIGLLKKEENRAVEEFQGNLSETLELFHQIKATNKEEYFFSKTTTKADELKNHAIEYGYKSDVAMKWSYLVFLNGYEVFRAVSILAVAYSDLSIGLMLAIFSYLWIMVMPTQDIINFQYALATAKAACGRINGIFEMEQERLILDPQNPFLGKDGISIELKNVSFAYKEGKEILKNINMKLEPGQKIAIVGASGSGKTTLANLIVGFYHADRGEIYYDGIPSKNIALSTVRENIHLILQHPKLFHDTIRFNLTLGHPYSDEEIHQALTIAQLDDVVTKLENGLDTKVGRDGIKLSGGQRQRVAIARMILSNPKVVIFDESTSALDTHTEIRLFKALSQFLAQKTVITIAHRPSTIQNADMIFVLEHGELIDSGTPEILLARENSYFANMH
ncbi:MAG: ABC transporter ATP-binding protein [Campylobacterales bacterium]|nr:ABC transporter ATP-binding protein [Campylobacterales bacterium]